MKITCYIVLLFFTCLSQAIQAQAIVTPALLQEPAGWEFERFALPPAFAPGFPYRGVEELRFSPGMFKKDSADYFTYAFVAQLDSTAAVSGEDVKNYLLEYFRGLCSSTAKQRSLSVDTAAIAVDISKNDHHSTGQVIYNVVAGIFGVFTDGAPVKLNMEVKVVSNAAAKQTFLVFIASPQKKDHAVWKRLYQVQQDFTAPL
jgi:hypothetical protein